MIGAFAADPNLPGRRGLHGPRPYASAHRQRQEHAAKQSNYRFAHVTPPSISPVGLLSQPRHCGETFDIAMTDASKGKTQCVIRSYILRFSVGYPVGGS